MVLALPALRAAVLTARNRVTTLFGRFRFDTDAGAGAVPSPLSETGAAGSITVVDTAAKASIATSELTLVGKSTWGDPGFRSTASLARRAGLALVGKVRPVTLTTNGGYTLAWSSSTVIGTTTNFAPGGVRWYSGSNGVAYYDGNSVNSVLAPLPSQTLTLASILRNTGSYFAVLRDRWKLQYVSNLNSASPLYPSATVYDTTFALDDREVVDLAGNFRADYGFALYRNASPVTGETFAAKQNIFLEFTWTPAAGETLDIMVRRQDDNNGDIIRCVQATPTIALFEKIGGTETSKVSVGRTWTIGTPYRICALVDNHRIALWVDGTYQTQYGSFQLLQDQLGVKLSGFATGSNLTAYPLALPITYRTGAAIDPALAWALNQPAPLTTPTYDGSGQATHPDVLDFGATGWQGHRYWMCMTPYPGGVNTYENPSLLVSEDGDTWTVPSGLTNPVVPWSGITNEYNADGCLCMDPTGTTMYLFHRWTNLTASKVYVLSSTDGITWSAPTEILSGALLNDVAPTVLYDGTQYVMWAVNGTSSPYVVERRTASNPLGPWSAATTCALDTPSVGANLGHWHVDVIIADGVYYMADALIPTGGFLQLWLATSRDGLTWQIGDQAILLPGAKGHWTDNRIYRTSLVRTAAGFDAWYGAQKTTGTTWHIGRTTIQAM